MTRRQLEFDVPSAAHGGRLADDPQPKEPLATCLTMALWHRNDLARLLADTRIRNVRSAGVHREKQLTGYCPKVQYRPREARSICSSELIPEGNIETASS
jgi:hypothetical protein